MITKHINQIVHLNNNCYWTHAKIGRKFGCGPQNIRYILSLHDGEVLTPKEKTAKRREARQDREQKRKGFNAARKLARRIQYWEDGLTMKQISKRLGISRESVNNFMSKYRNQVDGELFPYRQQHNWLVKAAPLYHDKYGRNR